MAAAAHTVHEAGEVVKIKPMVGGVFRFRWVGRLATFSSQKEEMGSSCIADMRGPKAHTSIKGRGTMMMRTADSLFAGHVRAERCPRGQ